MKALAARCNNAALPVKPALRRVYASRPVIFRGSPKCAAVKLDTELEALLASALERSSCEVADRVGIIGLKLKQGKLAANETGQFLWEAGVQLSCYIRDYLHKGMPGKRVLELGAGNGLVGLTCACFGGNVLLTDLPQVLPVTEANIMANEHIYHTAGGDTALAVLDWDTPAPTIVDGAWDLIIGSDLVYEPHHADVLAPLLARLLSTSANAKVLLAHTHRGDELDDYMTEVFAQHGLRIREAVRTGKDVPEQDISIIDISRL